MPAIQLSPWTTFNNCHHGQQNKTNKTDEFCKLETNAFRHLEQIHLPLEEKHILQFQTNTFTIWSEISYNLAHLCLYFLFCVCSFYFVFVFFRVCILPCLYFNIMTMFMNSMLKSYMSCVMCTIQILSFPVYVNKVLSSFQLQYQLISKFSSYKQKFPSFFNQRI